MKISTLRMLPSICILLAVRPLVASAEATSVKFLQFTNFDGAVLGRFE
ncbi:MAG: hypothetical protein ACI9FR_000556 [Cryomorphaceae bacterium]|jgi:hypothetical protein